MFNLDQTVKKMVSTGRQASQIIHKLCKIGQYILVVVFYTLLTTLSYIYLSTLFELQKDLTWSIIWFCGGFWVMFNMVFNYTMSVLVKPGTPSDFSYNEISYIEHKCKKCLIIKPPRTHHCSMCGQCVLQMDHHCPWIGQCVGHHNRAYFMNFLTYTFIGLILIERIMNDYMGRSIYKQDVDRDEVSPMFFLQIYIFITTLIVILGLFSTFHWMLVLKGKTTLECCLNDQRYTPSNSWSDNMKLVFGTSNVILILMPNLSVLKNKGYSWGTVEQERNQNTSMIEVEITNLDSRIQNQKYHQNKICQISQK